MTYLSAVPAGLLLPALCMAAVPNQQGPNHEMGGIDPTRTSSGPRQIMEHLPSNLLSLTVHPQTPDPWVERLAVSVTRAGGQLHLTYVLEGRLSHLRIPSKEVSHLEDPLWEHTCLEVFIARPGEARYHEFNFSPSGAWAIQGFRGYREKVGSPLTVGPRIAVEVAGNRLVLDAEISLDSLSPAHGAAPLKLALAAVVEHQDGTKSYWALHHGVGQPDFHKPECFTLLLPEGGIGSRP